MESIAGKAGCTTETLREWVRQAERDQGNRAGLSISERDRLKELVRGNRELKRANDALRRRRLFRPGGAGPGTEVMVAFSDSRRDDFGAEPICATLPIAPQVYHEQPARRADPTGLPPRSHRDATLSPGICRVNRENLSVYRSDRGAQHLSIRHSERLSDIGTQPSVGSTGDWYDNALAETGIGLFKTEVIQHRGPWKDIDAAEFASLESTGSTDFNLRRLLRPIGDVPPAALETTYYRQRNEPATGA